MKSFPYPLPLHALDEFRHPAEASVFHRPAFHAGETLVGNGHIALRIRKGHWFDEDHAPASPEFLERFDRLGWDFSPVDGGKWHLLDSVRGTLFRHAGIGFWLNGKPAPTPLVWIGDRLRVRLSLLQLVSRLPRAEVCAQPHALLIRFSGGMGIAPRDKRLDQCGTAFSLFAPERCPYDGRELGKRSEVRLEVPGRNWPPPEPID